MCSGDHHLWNCSEFQAKPVTERIAFMRRSRLCDNCCKKGHIGRYCRKDGQYTVVGCRWKHHALLHQQQNGSSLPSTSDSQRKDIAASPTPKTVGMTAAIQTNCKTNKIFLNVVPVRVSAGGNFVDTLTFLDQGSATTLCHECLLHKLEICGEQANYSVSTINQTKECSRGRKARMSVSSL